MNNVLEVNKLTKKYPDGIPWAVTNGLVTNKVLLLSRVALVVYKDSVKFLKALFPCSPSVLKSASIFWAFNPVAFKIWLNYVKLKVFNFGLKHSSIAKPTCAAVP